MCAKAVFVSPVLLTTSVYQLVCLNDAMALMAVTSVHPGVVDELARLILKPYVQQITFAMQVPSRWCRVMATQNGTVEWVLKIPGSLHQ